METRLIPVDSMPVEVTVLEDVAKDGYIRFKAIGSIANVKYKSGRLIPANVQQSAIKREQELSRQMTSFIDHPKGDPRGTLADVAAITEQYHYDDETNRTILDEIRVLKSSPKGQLLGGLIEDGVRVGVSQRAVGRQSLREWNGETVYLVEDIVRIFGWDFTPLDDANAGEETELISLSDSVVAEICNSPAVGEEDGDSVYDNQNEGNEAMKEKKSSAPKLSEIVDAIDGLFTAITDGFKVLDDAGENSGEIPAKVADHLGNARNSVKAIVEDSELTDDQKLEKLQAIAGELKDTISNLENELAAGSESDEEDESAESDEGAEVQDNADESGASEEAGAEDESVGDAGSESEEEESVEDSGASEEAEEEEPEETAESEEDESVTDDSGEEEGSELLGSVVNATSGLRGILEERKLKRTLKEKVEALTDASAEEQSAILDRLTSHSFTDEGAIDVAVEDAVAFVKAGRATERLVNEGIEKGERGNMEIQVKVDESLRGVQMLADSLVQSGEFHPHSGGVEKLITPEDPRAVAILKQFDSLYGDELLAESRYLADAVQTADFQTPRTLSRLILSEVYSDYIIPEITDFGTMDNDRDSIPITKYTRDGNRTFRPSQAQIAALKPGELQAMAAGKLTTTFFDIDASARKLDITLSDEFITRSKRKPNISGVARALENMVSDIRRTLQQEVFWNMLQGAMKYNSSAFTYNDTGDGTTTVYTVIASAASSISAGDVLTVTVNSVTTPEYGFGGAATLQYIVDYANATVSFVDENGAPSAPGNTLAIVVNGNKVTNETRFNMNNGSVEWEVHMNRLLFTITDQAAAMPTNTGYIPNLVIASLVNSNYIRQARAYENQGARSGYSSNGPVREGNMGLIGGQYSQWASEVFFADFILVGLRDATVFRTYEPLHLEGPAQARDSSGALIAGKEYYAYQEDALTTPVPEKWALVTLYNS